ncbi:hypothetical protein V2J09_006446 [Rumex salicifolius]
MPGLLSSKPYLSIVVALTDKPNCENHMLIGNFMLSIVAKDFEKFIMLSVVAVSVRATSRRDETRRNEKLDATAGEKLEPVRTHLRNMVASKYTSCSESSHIKIKRLTMDLKCFEGYFCCFSC